MNLKVKSWRDIGIRSDNLLPSLVPYSLLTVILISGLFLILKTFSIFSVSNFVLWHKLYPSLVVLVALSTLQELFFRGYLIFVLKSFSRSVFTVVIIDAILFAAIHLVFPYPLILFPAAFLAGIGFASVYYYYPNLFLVSLVHVLLLVSQIPFWYFRLVSF